MTEIIPPFVKKFDFRGVYNKDITDKDAYYLGLALFKSLPIKKLLVGWDTRVSSKNLARNFICAMKKMGVEISYMDMCPIDYVTAAAQAADFDLSVMFTGSHNPWSWTGLLMHTHGGNSVEGELVAQIVSHYYEAIKEPYVYEPIDLTNFHDFTAELEAIYTKKLQLLIPLSEIKACKVLVDIGDGSGSRSLSLLEKLLPQVTFTRLNDRKVYDQTSSHTADPSNIENMKQLIDTVKNGTYDCGFAFDSDADRVLAVDEKGTYLNGSLLGSAMIDAFGECEITDTKFGYAVDCGPALYNTVVGLSENQPTYTVQAVPVGRSLMRGMIRDGKVDFAVENVGHFYSREFFMTDSGAFSLVVILLWMTHNGPLSSLLIKHADGSRDQIFALVRPESESTLSLLHDKINTPYEGKKEMRKIEVDGVRYEFFEDDTLTTWYTVRKSGYEPIEKYYFGSLNNEDFTFLKETFSSLLKTNQELNKNGERR